MKKQLLCGVAASALTMALSGTTLAADMPVKAAPLPGCIWSGVYVGGHVGWGKPGFKGTFIGASSVDPQDFKHHPSGLLGGGQVGQNWCSNTFVYGWEADVSFMNWKKTSEFINTEADTLTNKLSLLSSLRAKLGITIDPRTLLYVTGGPAYARGKATMFLDEGIPTTLTAKFNKFGGVVGLGFEQALTNNWSWRLEGLYYILNVQKTLDDTLGSGDFATDKLKDVFVIRLGLNYKFGDPWGKGPVVAKY
jgi:outer membrane immunogenic protein